MHTHLELVVVNEEKNSLEENVSFILLNMLMSCLCVSCMKQTSILFLLRNSLINIILFLLLKLKIFNVEIFKAIFFF
jgi:hypothetical protein